MYISDSYKVLFMPVPKSGCTTVKSLLWHMNSEHLPKQGIHKVIVTKEFKKSYNNIRNKNLNNYYKFCVVRDPVDRLISAYNHRVLMLGEIRKNINANNKNLPKEPTFEQFVNRLEEYKKIFIIYHHVSPMCDFLGNNPNFYDRIYKLSEINTDLIPFLEDKCGHKLQMKIDINKSEHSIKRKDLPVELINKIKIKYQKDYDIYGKYL